MRALDDIAHQLTDAAMALGRGKILRVGGRYCLRDGRLSGSGEQGARKDQCGDAKEKRVAAPLGPRLSEGFRGGRLVHCILPH